MLTEAQKEMLAQDIPPRAIFKKQDLDYVKSGWVIAEANRIFGPDGWSHEVVESEWFEVKGKPQGRAVVKVSLVKDGRVYAWHSGAACGTGHGFDGFHQAVSEAETDALKRALSKFGRRLGLQLYLDERTDTRPMPGDMPAKIVGALEGANGDAAKLVRVARARLSEYAATPEQRREIEAAIARVEARA